MAASRPLRETPLLGALVRVYEERLTERGRAVLWAMTLFAAIGVDTRRTQVFKLFAAAFAALVIARVFNLFRPRVSLECALPARATALYPLEVTARVTGDRNGVPADLLLHFPRPIRWGDSIRYTPRESRLAARADGGVQAKVEMRALRRGRYVLRGPSVRRTDPLGLTTSPGVRVPDQPLLVYPRFYRMENFVIPLGRRYQPGGIPLSSSTGDAIEFVGTRDYREGDPVKNIHWRSWARRGEPVVKEYQEEYFCRIAIILDTFLPKRPRPADAASFEAAISVVASIADFFSRSEYIVDILAAGPDIYEVSAGRSLGYLENILDVLSCLEPSYAPPFKSIGPHLFDKLAQITTVVAVLQDWDPVRRDFLRRVKELGTGVRVLIVHDGETTEPWQAATAELGDTDLFTPADVERQLSAGAPHA